ncbi:MarR family transcriptional regulator [Erwinia sp. S43]|uniref:MarR family winged helix-turn-helix transcriptional regulator n=1 Tax=Erwinia sp. S43 TaxID=2769339 RepID=UPI00190CD673|nr:MarR family transcriptional regulator [Erwinia sp. S43]MBK0035784.1 MarR family transcriptional regulator [Erwinia sp. S43]
MNREALLEEVGMQLVLLARLYRQELDKALKPYGLTETAALPMRYLARLGEDVRQGRLTEILNIEGPTLVRTLDQLVECGLVEREADRSDRRANVVRLTREGKRLHQSMRLALQVVRETLFRDVSDAEAKTTLKALNALQRNLDPSRVELSTSLSHQ